MADPDSRNRLGEVRQNLSESLNLSGKGGFLCRHRCNLVMAQSKSLSLNHPIENLRGVHSLFVEGHGLPFGAMPST